MHTIAVVSILGSLIELQFSASDTRFVVTHFRVSYDQTLGSGSV